MIWALMSERGFLFYLFFCSTHSYISNPEGKLTNDWLKKGTYQIESMGGRFTANIHLRSPFDSGHSRLQVTTLQKLEVCAQRNVPAKRFKICYILCIRKPM